MNPTILTNIVNSALVSFCTSAVLTFKNVEIITLQIWATNWVVSWFIVFCYMTFIVLRVKEFIFKRLSI
jgi:hypothetical protein